MINIDNTYRYRVIYFLFLAFLTKWVLHELCIFYLDMYLLFVWLNYSYVSLLI
jgi:hypothetical protein